MIPIIKKSAAAILAVILAASLLTACSKGEQADTASGTESSEETSAAEGSSGASDLTQEEALAMLAEDVNEMREKEAQKAGDTASTTPEESSPPPQESSSEPAPQESSSAPQESASKPAEPETPQQTICREALGTLKTVLNPGSPAPAPAEEVKPAISEEEQSKVSNLLKSIPPEELDLHTDLSNYKLNFATDTTEVEGKECYNVQAVKKDTLRKEIMGMFYVATDESAVFKYDVLTGASIPVNMNASEE